MLTFILITTILTALTASTSALFSQPLVLHEKRDNHPASFTNQGPADPSVTLTLRIALVPADIDGLKDKLIAVSTPDNAAYGQHLSREEVRHTVFRHWALELKLE